MPFFTQSSSSFRSSVGGKCKGNEKGWKRKALQVRKRVREERGGRTEKEGKMRGKGRHGWNRRKKGKLGNYNVTSIH